MQASVSPYIICVKWVINFKIIFPKRFSCDIWWTGTGSIMWNCPEPCEPLEWPATDITKSIVILCPKCNGTTHGDPPNPPSWGRSWFQGTSNVMLMRLVHRVNFGHISAKCKSQMHPVTWVHVQCWSVSAGNSNVIQASAAITRFLGSQEIDRVISVTAL